MLATMSAPSGMRPNSPLTAEFCAFLCTPNENFENAKFNFSAVNDSKLLTNFSELSIFIPSIPHISAPYTHIVD